MRQLPPWFENVGKRQIRSPKVYLRDSGLLHALLGISSFAALEAHPKLGASWEGFALEENVVSARDVTGMLDCRRVRA
jgi:predicted AAA+ superfamily ATPase